MKLKNSLIILAAASALAATAQAQVQLTFVGSTAFRSAVKDRLTALYDANSSFHSNLSNSTTLYYEGTMSNAVPSLGTNTVVIRTSFSGSLSGMIAIRDNTLQPCINLDGTATNLAGDVGFGEAFPSAATPPIPNSDFSTNEIIGVVPFVVAVNNNLAAMGINNITEEQLSLAMFDTGPGAMPASFLGATGAGATNNVYLIGRDTDSGTRISTEKVIKYIGAETEWGTNGGGTYISSPGFASGGTVANNIRDGALSIGYLGMSDFNTITNNATALNFVGVGIGVNNFSNVTTGAYPLWGYEHFYSRIGTSAQQTLVREALISSLTDTTYQATNANWFNFFVGLTKMQVSRSTDGGQITGNNF